MSLITQQIMKNLENLPEEMQEETLDFVRFLKAKLNTQSEQLKIKHNGKK